MYLLEPTGALLRTVGTYPELLAHLIRSPPMTESKSKYTKQLN